MTYITALPHRGVLRLTGKDRAAFLQGLVTNDVTAITPARSVYAALLTPQGKFQYDLFMAAHEDGGEEAWFMDCDGGIEEGTGWERAETLRKRLSLYKLRSDVGIETVSDRWSVFALWGANALTLLGLSSQAGATKPLGEGMAFVDPRLADLGARLIVPYQDAETLARAIGGRPASFEDYDLHRLRMGVPDGRRDARIDRGILLECGFEELQAIDWEKGCYMGQELTARTRYRGLVRKRLIPVHIQGEKPASPTPIMQGEAEVGDMRTVVEDWGMAMLRLEALPKSLPFQWGSALLKPHVPAWMRLPSLTEGQ